MDLEHDAEKVSTLFAVVKLLQGQIDDLVQQHEKDIAELNQTIKELTYRVDSNEFSVDELRGEDRYA